MSSSLFDLLVTYLLTLLLIGGLFVETVLDLLHSQNRNFGRVFPLYRLTAISVFSRIPIPQGASFHFARAGWQRNQQASEFFAIDIILHNMDTNCIDLLPNHLRGDPCGSWDSHFGAHGLRFSGHFVQLPAPEGRAAETRSTQDGERSRYAGTPCPNRQSHPGRGPLRRVVLNSRLSSR